MLGGSSHCPNLSWLPYHDAFCDHLSFGCFSDCNGFCDHFSFGRLPDCVAL